MASKPGHALIVSDSRTVRMHVSQVLQDAGYTCADCEGARCSAEVLHDQPYSVIVLDSQPELLRAVREDPMVAHVPVVVLSDDTRGEHLELPGPRRVLAKAFDDDELTGAIAAMAQSPGAGPPCVLVIDDSYTFREELAEGLRQLGFEVRLADSAASGLSFLRTHPVDVVLMDLVMPDVAGDVACRQIRSDPAMKGLAVLMITAQEDQETLLRCFDAGADDFIAKSADFRVIRARVLAHLRRKHLEDRNRKISEELARKTTEAAQSARMRELYEEAKSAIAARDEFLSIASHELKTPLCSLQLHIQSLKRVTEKTRRDTPATELLPKLANADKQIHRLTKLIEDLLDVSRIRNQRFSFEFCEIDLAEIVRDVVKRFEGEAESVGSELSLDVPAPVTGCWDSARIEQVVTNLVSNALRYGQGKSIEVSVTRRGEEALIVVEDHGMGISDEDKERIFRRFERAVSANNYGGLGLGLFISDEIVRAHGGRIQVESKPGSGARFIVSLPVRPRGAAAA